MRRVLYNELTNDAELNVFYPGAVFSERGALVDSPAPPFAVIAWGLHQSNGPGLATRTVQVYFHDARGSYDRNAWGTRIIYKGEDKIVIVRRPDRSRLVILVEIRQNTKELLRGTIGEQLAAFAIGHVQYVQIHCILRCRL